MSEQMEQLIGTFSAASRGHYQATMEGDYEAANIEADRVHQAFLKLRELGTEAREALIGVALGGNDAVAVVAAVYSLKYAPDRALEVLKRCSRDRGVVGFQASQAMKRWKSGEWQLE